MSCGKVTSSKQELCGWFKRGNLLCQRSRLLCWVRAHSHPTPPNHLGVKTFLIFQHIGPGRCSMRVSAVQQFTPGECTLFRLAHNLSMSITPNHCAYVILTHSLPNIPLLWTKTLEHHLLVNCGIRVDLKAATFSLFGQSSTNISAH